VRKWFRSVNYEQGILVPHDMRSWLPPDHLAWRFLEVTGQLDLTAFRAAYRDDGQGQAPYDPAMMLTLVFYCYFKSVLSSRRIAAACVDDVGCRVICGGGRGPSHKTVAEFKKRHRAAIVRLFPQALGILAAEGAVEGHTAAIDGSPASGNASRFGNLTGGQLEDRIAAAEQKLAAAVAEWLGGAGAVPRLDEDGDDGDDGGAGLAEGRLPRRVSALAAKLGRLRAARDVLAGRAAAPGSPQDKAAAARAKAEKEQAALDAAEAAQDALVARYQASLAAGKPWRYGKRPEPKEANKKLARRRDRARQAWDKARAAEEKAAILAAEKLKVNPADPGTRLLPAKNGGGWEQGWNLEFTAARRQVLLSIGLHDSPADAGALVPSVTSAQANIAAAALWPGAAALALQFRAWAADSGFASAANFAALAHLLLLVAVTSEATQTGRRDGGRAVPQDWQQMQARLATPAGKALYKRRAAQVEPAFAQYFARFGRRFHERGHDAVHAEASLRGTVHNLGKLFAHRDRAARRKRPAPAPA
jgi:transposase